MKQFKYLFIITFVISSFLFVERVKADYKATVLNASGAKCELLDTSTGYCFYENENLNSYVDPVKWLDNGDEVTVLTEQQSILSENLELCPDYYVYTMFQYDSSGTEYKGYYCNAYLTTGILTEELKKEFTDLGFPESYHEKLAILKTAHPNWEFRAIKTNLEWKNVVDVESAIGTSLIQGPEGYRSILGGSYNYYTDEFTVKEGSDWYAANSSVVSYYLDPRNFLNDMYIFQFENLESNPEIQTLDTVSVVLKDNYLANNAEDFITAALDSGVSSVYLAALALQEVGGGSVATSGEGFTYSSFNNKYFSLRGKWIEGGFYNVYNIGAGTDKSPAQNSVVYARGGENSNETDFDRPWNTMTKAIVGGAKFIGDKYITKGQQTIYFKKFNVASTYWDIYSHQYQTNIKASTSEGNKIYMSYSELNMLDSNFVFSIPVYNNMPESTSLPNSGNPNNYLKTLKVNDTLVTGFDGADENYEVYVANNIGEALITAETVNSNAKVTNIGSKELIVGENKFTLSVTAQNGDIKNYNLKIIRSENEIDEPLVDDIVNEIGIKSDGTYFSGIALNTNSSDLINKILKISSTAKVEITDCNGIVKENQILSTGDIVSITSANETKKYTVVIYGDTSGDGKINALDLLRTQKHILNATDLTGAFYKAADVSKEGKIDVLDLLKIQKHILEVSFIEQ